MLETGSMWIINMAPIQNSLAIYKDTSIFIAEYTGSGEEHITYNPERAALAVKAGKYSRKGISIHGR